MLLLVTVALRMENYVDFVTKGIISSNPAARVATDFK